MAIINLLQTILDRLKGLWSLWNVQICILTSLLLQVTLLFFAPCRKLTRRKVVIFTIWAAYLLSNWIATVAIGIIFKSKDSNSGGGRKSKNRNEDFVPMWASFLLLHLGGPDSITSYSIADNQLWIRHLTSLLLQVFTVVYIVYVSLFENKMQISTVMVFVAGTIKYSERTRALFLGSLDRFGRSVLPKPNPGLDYEEATTIYAGTNSVDVPASKEEKPTQRTAYAKASEDKGQIISQSETKLVKGAYRLFQSFKGLVAGHLLSSRVRVASRRYFRTLTPKQAFSLVAYERSFMYDVLHTKVVLFRKVSGYVLRCISIISLLVALFNFRSIEGQYRVGYESQVRLSYPLFIGALGSEAISVLTFLCSDWRIIALKSRWRKLFLNFILSRQRWSMSFSGYDMISHCLHRPPERLCKLAEFAHLGEPLDKICTWYFSHLYMVKEELQEFIFQQLEYKARDAETLQAGSEACSRRGDGPLQEYDHLLWSIQEYQYAESLLLWHVATEIQYHTSEYRDPEGNGKEICKQISDYMFYILVMHPILKAPVFGNWQVAFQDTYEEARRFFTKKDAKEPSKACKEALKVKTPYRPATVKGSTCKSVFFDAILLAKQLSKVPGQWTLMSEVWMEMMSHAAIRCTPNEHAQQYSTGGEFLTLVWLLMNHFGLGTQFYEHEVDTRTTMIRLSE